MSTQTQRGRRVQRKAKSQLRTFYWIIGGVAVLGAAFLISFAVAGGFGQTAATPAAEVDYPVGTTPEGFYYKGSPDAPVKVIEYADFQCPACATYARSIGADVTTQYVKTGKIQLIYHDFPLSQHPNAPKASESARCAGEQGKFWQYHDTLYANQSEWAALSAPANRFIAYASQLGLDRSQFQSCLNSGKYTAQVAQAGQAATAANVPATPTFLVEGQMVNSLQLTSAIDAALAARGVK